MRRVLVLERKMRTTEFTEETDFHEIEKNHLFTRKVSAISADSFSEIKIISGFWLVGINFFLPF